MAFGTVSMPTTIQPVTSTGITAIVETKAHVLSGSTHTWPGEWVRQPHLRANRVSWNPDDRPNLAEIEMLGVRVEDWQDYLGPVDQVRVKMQTEEEIIDPDTDEIVTAIVERVIFRGWPAAVSTMLSDESEDINVTCLGLRYFLDRIPVESQWVWGVDAAGTGGDLHTSFPVIFNEGGRMNRMSGGGALGTGREVNDEYFLFHWPAITEQTTEWENHEFWTAGQAMEYIISAYADPDSTISLWDELVYLDIISLDDVRLPEINVEGMTVTQALTEVLNGVGYHWCVLPDLTPLAAPGDDRGWGIWWWNSERPVKAYDLSHPQVGAGLSAMALGIEANRLDINIDYRSIVNSYLGIASPTKYEQAWELKKAWTASEAQDDENYYRSGKDGTANPDWETYKNVFRRWAFDGAGILTGTPKDFDATVGAYYQERPRFLDDEALTPEGDDESGTRKPAQVFLYHDGSWKRIDGNVYILGEGLADGIYIDGKALTVDGGTEGEDLVSVMQNVTKVAVITGVDGDVGLREVRGDSASEAAYLTRRRSLNLSEFRKEIRNTSTPNYGAATTIRDDTTKMQNYLDEKLRTTKDPVMSVSVSLPIPTYLITPGTLIQTVVGRDIEVNSDVVVVDIMLDPDAGVQLSLADARLRYEP